MLTLLLFIASITAFWSCGKRIVYSSQKMVADGKYDLAYPFGGKSEDLKGILESVRLLNSTAYYESYVFPYSAQIEKTDVNKSLFKANKHSEKTVYNDFAVGTATFVYYNSSRVAVLTCAHVVDFADTVITFYEAADTLQPTYVRRVSIKKSQRNSVVDMREGEEFDILAADYDLDVALLGKRLNFVASENFPVFKYARGSAKELDWGNLLYLVGYPSGKKMITTGIVSSPDRTRNHGFLVDALFNRGFSGGIALAVRDGVPNFELVGIVNAVAADHELIIAPGEFPSEFDINLSTPYRGDLFVQIQKKINYGVAYGISIDAIIEFIQENRKELRDQGYIISNFFNGL